MKSCPDELHTVARCYASSELKETFHPQNFRPSRLPCAQPLPASSGAPSLAPLPLPVRSRPAAVLAPALGTDPKKLHAVFLKPVPNEALSLAVERILVRQSQILEPPALQAPNVIVLAMGNLKPSRFPSDFVFLDASFVRQLPKIPIHRSETDRGRLPPGHVKDLMGRRMVPASLHDLKHQPALPALAGGSAALGYCSAFWNRVLENRNDSYSQEPPVFHGSPGMSSDPEKRQVLPE